MKSIDLIFDDQGEVNSEAFGFKGKGCEAAAKFIEQALGLVTKRTHKAEYGLRETTVTAKPKLRT
jgi:hypothetical protein